MAKLINNPYELLKQSDVPKTLLNEKAQKALLLFDKVKVLYDKRPDNKEFKDDAEKAGKMAIQIISKEIERIKNETRNEIEEQVKKEEKKHHSRKIIEKSEVVLDDLALCRQRLKEDRQHKIESGEISPPKKKTLTTKLRQELIKTATLIPQNLKEDVSVIERTQRAVLKFLAELKEIWGLNRIGPIQEELKEKFKKLQEHAA